MNKINNYRELAEAMCKSAIKENDFSFFKSEWFNDVISFFVDIRIVDYAKKLEKEYNLNCNKIVQDGYSVCKELIDDDFYKTYKLISQIKL